MANKIRAHSLVLNKNNPIDSDTLKKSNRVYIENTNPSKQNLIGQKSLTYYKASEKKNEPTLVKEHHVEKVKRRNLSKSLNQAESSESEPENFASSYYLNSHRKKEPSYESAFQKMVQLYHENKATAYDLADMVLHRMVAELIMRQRANSKGANKVKERVQIFEMKKFEKKVEQNHKQKSEVKRLQQSMKDFITHIIERRGEEKFHRSKGSKDTPPVYKLEADEKYGEDVQAILNHFSSIRGKLSKKSSEVEILQELEKKLKKNPLSIFKMLNHGGVVDLKSDDESQPKTKLIPNTEEAKLEKYLDLKMLKSKINSSINKNKDPNDLTDIKNTVRRTLCREFLKDYERKCIQDSGLQEVWIKNKTDSLTKPNGISVIAITELEAENIKRESAGMKETVAKLVKSKNNFEERTSVLRQSNKNLSLKPNSQIGISQQQYFSENRRTASPNYLKDSSVPLAKHTQSPVKNSYRLQSAQVGSGEYYFDERKANFSPGSASRERLSQRQYNSSKHQRGHSTSNLSASSIIQGGTSKQLENSIKWEEDNTGNGKGSIRWGGDQKKSSPKKSTLKARKEQFSIKSVLEAQKTNSTHLWNKKKYVENKIIDQFVNNTGRAGAGENFKRNSNYAHLFMSKVRESSRPVPRDTHDAFAGL